MDLGAVGLFIHTAGREKLEQTEAKQYGPMRCRLGHVTDPRQEQTEIMTHCLKICDENLFHKLS